MEQKVKEFAVSLVVSTPEDNPFTLTEDTLIAALMKMFDKRGWNAGGGVKEMEEGVNILPRTVAFPSSKVLASQTVTDAEKEHRVYISIVPELYQSGTNWNWQLQWFEGQDAVRAEKNGSFWFGDNGEHPTRESAERAAIQFAKTLREHDYAAAIKEYNENTYGQEKDNGEEKEGA
jgi:hypothetical protein